jgi:hypothetical protein
MLQDRLGLSERRVCRIAGQHRSTQHSQMGIRSGARRGRAARPSARDLAGASALGLPARARPAARGGLVSEPQEDAAALARGGAARAAAVPEAATTRRVDGAGEAPGRGAA